MTKMCGATAHLGKAEKAAPHHKIAKNSNDKNV